MLSFKEYSELNESTEAIDAIQTVLNHPKIKPHIDNVNKVNKVMDSVNKHIKIYGPIFADKLAQGFNEALGPGAVGGYTLPPILTTALEIVANRHKFMGKK